MKLRLLLGGFGLAISSLLSAEPADLVRQADAAIHQDQWTSALTLLKQAAEQQNQTAQLKLGLIYLNGVATKQTTLQSDYDRARFWLLKVSGKDKAADAGLGDIYWNGLGVKRDAKQALAYYNRAVSNEPGQCADGFYRLALINFYGYDVPRDYRKAAEWIKRGQALNPASDPETDYVMALLYFWGEGGMPQDKVKAREFLVKAVGEKDAPEDWRNLTAAGSIDKAKILSYYRVPGGCERAYIVQTFAPTVWTSVSEKRPLLQWMPYPGAHHYLLGWFEIEPATQLVLKHKQNIITTKTEYQFEEDIVPDRIYQWDIEAWDEKHRLTIPFCPSFITGKLTREEALRWDEEHDRKRAEIRAVIGAGVRNGGVICGPGVILERVSADSPADQAGLREFDLITACNGHRIASIDDLYRFIHPGKKSLTQLKIERLVNLHQAALPITPEPPKTRP